MNELRVCARELETLEGEAFEEVQQRRRAYFEALHGIVKQLGTDSADRRDSWLATANLFGMLNWIYMWYPAKEGARCEALADQLLTLFLEGYLPREARGAHAGREDEGHV